MIRPANKGKKFPAEVYSRDEMDRLLKATGRGVAGKRNKAMLMMGWRCGLRLDEVLGLKAKDVDLSKGAVRVLHGKGDQARTVGLPEDARDALQLWVNTRKALGCKKTQPLFCTISEGRGGDEAKAKPYEKCGKLSHAYVRTVMGRLRNRADIDKRVHFHGLRHTFAWELSEEGKPVAMIQRALGHASLQTTATYLDHIAPHDLIEVMKDRG